MQVVRLLTIHFAPRKQFEACPLQTDEEAQQFNFGLTVTVPPNVGLFSNLKHAPLPAVAEQQSLAPEFHWDSN